MNLKKFLCLLLLITVVLAVASCGTRPTGGSAKKFTVTFDSNGGSFVEPQTVKSGSPVAMPQPPVREGYVFLGWFKGNNKWDFSKPVTSNMTLVAEWEADAYSCSHVDSNKDKHCDLCGADLAVTFTITYKDGYATLSSLRPNSYTIGDGNGKLDLPTAPAKPNYEFVGWFADSAFTQPVTEINTLAGTKLTFYAKYSPITYYLTYNLNGGTNAESNPESYNVTNTTLTLAEPTKEGHVFQGWYLDNAFTQPITEITKSNIGNLTLYARWASEADKFTVTYQDHLGNELLVETLYKSESDQSLRPSTEFPTLNVEGYSFLAWVNAADESQVFNVIPAGHSTDLVLKASLENEAVHNLLYYVDGMYFAADPFREIDGLTALLVPEKGGYTFDGWYLNRDCSGEKVTSIPANTLEDMKLYGKFIANEYTISFEIDGAPFDGGFDKYTTSDSAITLPGIPEKFGYVVLGWYTADGQLMEENKLAAGFHGNVVLHAEYEKVTYRIYYHLSGGNNSNNVDSYKFDELPELYDPTKSGYLFEGWYLDASFSTALENLSDYANQDITLYAKWRPVTEGSDGDLTPEVPF